MIINIRRCDKLSAHGFLNLSMTRTISHYNCGYYCCRCLRMEKEMKKKKNQEYAQRSLFHSIGKSQFVVSNILFQLNNIPIIPTSTTCDNNSLLYIIAKHTNVRTTNKLQFFLRFSFIKFFLCFCTTVPMQCNAKHLAKFSIEKCCDVVFGFSVVSSILHARDRANPNKWMNSQMPPGIIYDRAECTMRVHQSNWFSPPNEFRRNMLHKF